MGLFKKDYSDWRQGTARVLAQRGNEVDLEVSVDGRIYTTTTKQKLPDRAPNARLSVRVHPEKPEKLHVESAAEQAEAAELGGVLAQNPAAAEALQQVLGSLGVAGANVQVVDGGTQVIDATSVPGLREEILGALRQHGIAVPEGAEVPAPADDRISSLERLAKLHTDGVLTDEEFAAAKAKLLGS